MSRIAEIDRSIVAIFDIEGYSTQSPRAQAQLVEAFLTRLSQGLGRIGDVRPDVFSTGDGAIVTVGRTGVLDQATVRRFMDFILDFTTTMVKSGIVIRSVASYGENERLVSTEGLEGIHASFVQAGDSINRAARMMGFCEPREIMLDEPLHAFLRSLALHEEWPLVKNDPLLTKHGLELRTYTYDPPNGEATGMYSPRGPSHAYKKYSYFPPVKGSILEFFMRHHLGFTLDRVIADAFDSMRELNDTQAIITWHSVFDVLMNVKYEPEDTVYVLSRNDRDSGFWTQKHREQYIGHLTTLASKHGGFINQTRIRIHVDVVDDDKMRDDDIFVDLKLLHAPNTLFSLPASRLLRYRTLTELIFGFTLSKRHGFAIIPIPAPAAMGPDRVSIGDIGKTLGRLGQYDAKDGPMKAIITADPALVRTLVSEVEQVLKDDCLTTMR